MKKDVVAGLGEIGLPMQKLLSRTISVVGYDKKTELVNTQKLKKLLLLLGLIACKILRYLAETQRTSSKRDEENEKDLLECAELVV